MGKERGKGMGNEMRIILASASPRRRGLLRQVGLEPEVFPSHVDETAAGTEPEKVVRELSRQKALDVAARCKKRKENGQAGETKDLVVIGADTVVAVDGVILGKPVSREDAVRMVGMLQGRAHQVYTGVTICFGPGRRQVAFVEKTDVYVYPMDQRQISEYVAMGESMDKAGAYGIQGRFAAYVQRVEGDDNNVVGLPVGRVFQELLADRRGER